MLGEIQHFTDQQDMQLEKALKKIHEEEEDDDPSF